MIYTFWVKSSRMTDIEEDIKVNDCWKNNDEQLLLFVEDWCEEVFPMFRFTDAYVTYGYKEK